MSIIDDLNAPGNGAEELREALMRAQGGSYLGVVATGGRLPRNNNGGNQISGRHQRFARGNLLGSRWHYVNFIGPTETAPGAPLTLFASVEYPAGVFTPITFGGKISVVIPNGGSVWSDPLPADIPDGARVQEWTWAECTSGVPRMPTAPRVDKVLAGASVPNVTGTGDLTGMGNGDQLYCATAVIGQTNKPSVLILGDSRCSGSASGTSYGHNDAGNIVAPIARSYGVINLSVGGASITQYHENATQKLKGLAAYCSHIVIAGGIADVNTLTGSQLQANVALLIGSYNPSGTKPVALCTIEPFATSTDDWATEINQTIESATRDTNRRAYNEIVRKGDVVGQWDCFDIAAEIESIASPGKWLTPGLTKDGIHGTRKADLMMNRAVNVGFFGAFGYSAG